MKKKKTEILLLLISLFSLAIMPVTAQSYRQTGRRLLQDIPEPPNASRELASPVPVVYNFMEALTEGEFDKVLSYFDVQTFLELIFGQNILRTLNKEQYGELFAYQVQSQRSEFRFLSSIIHRVADGARLEYSDPRYHGKVQSKIVVRMLTSRGMYLFEVYCSYRNNEWKVYDYQMNNQRLTRVFISSLKNVPVSQYISLLGKYYGNVPIDRKIKNTQYGIEMTVPSSFDLAENVSPVLLASLAAYNGHFLMHMQASEYPEILTLPKVGQAIKDTLMPFSPRLYDQWKGYIADVEIGNVLFNFKQGVNTLYAHMVLIPLRKNLIILNFYHTSLAQMKHMSNLREAMIRTLALPSVTGPVDVALNELPEEINMDDPFGSNWSGFENDPFFADNDFGTSFGSAISSTSPASSSTSTTASTSETTTSSATSSGWSDDDWATGDEGWGDDNWGSSWGDDTSSSATSTTPSFDDDEFRPDTTTVTQEPSSETSGSSEDYGGYEDYSGYDDYGDYDDYDSDSYDSYDSYDNYGGYDSEPITF